MKKYIRNAATLAFAVFAVTSCSDILDAVDSNSGDSADGGTGETVSVEIELETEEFVTDAEFGSQTEPESRAYVGTYSGGLHNIWESGDQISVPSGTADKTHVLKYKSSVTGPCARFKGDIVSTTNNVLVYPDYTYNWGIATYLYPDFIAAGKVASVTIPAEQTVKSGYNLDKRALLMVGSYAGDLTKIQTSVKIPMRNVVALIAVKVDYDCHAIAINSNGLEPLAAQVSVDYNNGTPSFALSGDSETFNLCTPSVTLKGTSECLKAGTEYYIAVAPGTLNSGWTICCQRESDGKIFQYSCSSKVIWKRNRIYHYGTFTEANANGAGVVDLGLPSGVKLAAMNDGSFIHNHAGDFYAWGETETKKDYSYGNYKWQDGQADGGLGNVWISDQKHLTKYVLAKDADNDGHVTNGNPYFDNKTVLDNDDDVLIKKYGDIHYRIPNGDIVDELSNASYMTHSWATMDKPGMPRNSYDYYYANTNTIGVILKSVKNNKRVWVPVSGLASVNSNSDLTHYDAYASDVAQFQTTTIRNNTSWENKTFSVSRGTMNLTEGFQDGWVVRTNGVPVRAVLIPQPDAVRMYTELGNDVYWASTNLGAALPESQGDVYAWGEVYNKYGKYNNGTGFSWDTYRFGGRGAETRYNASDKRAFLVPADDVATIELGDGWSIPESTDFVQLVANSDIEHYPDGNTKYHGVSGFEFKSKVFSGNSIFLPAVTGYGYGGPTNPLPEAYGTQGNRHAAGYYWTNTLDVTSKDNDYDHPWYIHFYTSNSDRNYKVPQVSSGNSPYTGAEVVRCYGLPIRAIKRGHVGVAGF